MTVCKKVWDGKAEIEEFSVDSAETNKQRCNSLDQFLQLADLLSPAHGGHARPLFIVHHVI
jgi:hypothetical protein